ncbi:lipase family protein [Leucobacter chromiireducens]|uniref:lipase family protein n=1 Tax=Leucobacter chromiireducens TaxID=283877 RepID=UPI001F14EB3F|nr:lipase family protein [Leucobacter chromiireducens]
MPVRTRITAALAPLAGPARALIGLAAAALGATLFLAPLSAHQIAVVTGIGLALIGIAALLIPTVDGVTRAAARALGVVLLAAGALIALWPSGGAPWLAFLVGAALVCAGIFQVVQVVRGGGDSRVTSVIGALACVAFGLVAFSWPVLTLTVFRLGVGAFLVFFGLQLVFFALSKREPAARRPRGRLARWSRTAGAVLSLVLAVALALGTGWILGGVPLPQPGKFYAAPEQVPAEPGQLLRTERLSTGVPRGAEAWRILYTTTNADGTPALSSGTIVAPKRRGGDPLPLLSVAHGTTGVAAKCAPSLSATPFADGAGAALAQLVTEHGWAAVTSDYIGLGTAGTHPYLVGEAEARNVLDAARAAQQFAELSVSSETVVWGHSQGGQGALWTGQIAADYAPEIGIAGVAAFAPAANLYGLAEVNKNEATGKTVSAYIAATWDDLFPELGLAAELTPGSGRGVEKIQDLCFNGQDVLAAILRGTQVPNQIFPDRVLAGEFGRLLRAQTPIGPFPAPVLVAQGLADPLVRPEQQREWVADRCADGAELDYREYADLDHLSLVAEDSPLTPQLISWTLDRWAGTPTVGDCGTS